MLRRHEITDQQWEAIKDFLLGKECDPGATAKENRLCINAVMWIAQTGAPWRDLPERFTAGKSCSKDHKAARVGFIDHGSLVSVSDVCRTEAAKLLPGSLRIIVLA